MTSDHPTANRDSVEPGAAQGGDRFEHLSRQGNTRSDPHALAALWDAAFDLEHWCLVGRAVETPDGDAFAPLTADIDGKTFAAAFTDTERAGRFLSEQPEPAEVLELPLLEALEWLADLCLAGAAFGVIFNDGSAPFLAPIADLPELMIAHTPGYFPAQG